MRNDGAVHEKSEPAIFHKNIQKDKVKFRFVGIRVNRGKEFILERDHKFIRNFKQILR